MRDKRKESEKETFLTIGYCRKKTTCRNIRKTERGRVINGR